MASFAGLKPLGQLMDVGGFHLHARIMGASGPTVVMDTGLGGPGLLWDAIARALTPHARTVSVDRAGYGWSDSAPANARRTSETIVAEMRSLLRGLGFAPPYILVGHSFGGLNMILYAQTHRDEVSGLVLVDSSHPEQIKRLPGMMSAKALKQSMQLLLPLAHWGLMRWFNFALLRSSYPGLEVLAPEAQSAFTALASSPENYITAIREAEDLETSVTQMRVAPGVLGDLPLAVLTAGFWNSGGFMADTKQKWLAMQREHAAMSSRGTHTIVPNCNHASIVTHGRAAVVAAIQQVIKVHG